MQILINKPLDTERLLWEQCIAGMLLMTITSICVFLPIGSQGFLKHTTKLQPQLPGDVNLLEPKIAKSELNHFLIAIYIGQCTGRCDF